eukprot:TRINITY_DN4524_c0_g1_i2.p3 TRINITY_DN4524_c0_g1~~TRINITY_DN4524_c0_g1_i2.p3  ORF type:complete len:118 (+),score=22.90 TRINITY_DN4524_c0_g1_i2:997-1350(+)
MGHVNVGCSTFFFFQPLCGRVARECVGLIIFFFMELKIVINNRNNSNRMVENIKAVPDNAIIIESDWDSCAPQPEAMLTIASIISDVKGWTLHKTVTKTTENSERFFYGKTSKSEEK